MPERWIKEAEDLKSNGQSGTMSRNHSGVKVTWHVTVSPSGGSMFNAMHGVLTRNKSEPHILYDPLTDRLGQYFPLDRSARALANDGNRPTNRDGKINIQIEVVARPDGFTNYWKPGPNYKALMRAIRSWGVPDEWPAGRLSQHSNDNVSRSWNHYRKSGHFGHCNVPGNNHWDPGPINQAAIFTATQGHDGGAQDVPSTPSKPGKFKPLWKPTGKMSVEDIQRAVGVKADGLYGKDTKAAVKQYQKELGVTADGLWGKRTEAAHNRRKAAAKVPRRLLKRGSKGKRVRNLQRGLNRVFPSYSSLAVDGIFGRSTAAVVKEFQRRSGLSADGIVGKRTRAKLANYGVKA